MKQRSLVLALWLICLGAVVVSLALGAMRASPRELVHVLLGRGAEGDQLAAVIFGLRVPRVALGCLVGAALASGGVALQAIFRNRLADPGLVGVSSGAAAGAVLGIVVGGRWLDHVPFDVVGFSPRQALVPVAAFGGGCAAVAVVSTIARVGGRTSTLLLLLSGLAVSALASAQLGFVLFFATDAELRNVTFWSLGSLGGAAWPMLLAAAPLLIAAPLAVPRLGPALDLLQLGEAEAYAAGVRVERVKRVTILVVAASVGAAVASAGTIGFIGLVAPQLGRLLGATSQTQLVRVAVPLGIAVVVVADLVARTVAAPAELPIGTLTSLLGAPLFLSLILAARRSDVR